ncbi:MAG: carbamoyltransferase HypF [Spirochaetia bacterium]|nr:carbamoyltransferase HypF [Spirochaetia bacterium]
MDSFKVSEYNSSIIYRKFEIRNSIVKKTKKLSTLVPPDICLCSDCKKELFSIKNIRYRYPFINCTNCGPRYTILEKFPYDRKNTSMSVFPMCSTCENEYLNVLNRRFHAEPTCCSICGPYVKLFDNKNNILAEKEDAIKLFINKIKEGYIVALKGIGGFHLICDGLNNRAVKKLRIRKKRSDKPFAVMFSNIQEIKKYAFLSHVEEKYLKSISSPIVILKKKPNSLLAKDISIKINRVGAFLPYSPLHLLILKELKNPIVATSANISEEPIITDYESLQYKLSNVFDFVLDHNRVIINGCDDSVMRLSGAIPIVMRKARGMAVEFFNLSQKFKRNVLAVGAHQKNTFAFGIENKIIVSPHIGDLESLYSNKDFTNTFNRLKDIYNFSPDIVVHDMHPDYFSTHWAKNLNIPMFSIQHHHAHALSLMLENQFKKNDNLFTAVFDGTGYGTDKTLWGGELLNVSYSSFERIGHFQAFKLIGGEKAIKEPRRVALSLLFQFYGKDALKLKHIQQMGFTENELLTLYSIWQKDINCPFTSSAGRLFDAAGSILNIRQIITFEGETGLIMEDYYDSSIKNVFQYSIENGVISVKSIIEGLLNSKNKVIGASIFLNTIADIIIKFAEPYKEFGISGGVFQNSALVDKVYKNAKKKKLKLFTHIKYPPNDGAISLGQAAHLLYKE